MNIAPRYVVVVALVLTWLMPGARAARGQTVTGFAKGPQPSFGEANLTRVQQVLRQPPDTAAGFDDYYFLAVGDIQNNVRSFDRKAFEAIAKDVRTAVDTRSGKPVYDNLRFVILLGDLVYQGSIARQWQNLEMTFGGRGLDDVDYPNIARLVGDKPVFPAIGNHELLNFLLRPQTKYRDMFDSPLGVDYFKRFFGWDRFIDDATVRTVQPGPQLTMKTSYYTSTMSAGAALEFTPGSWGMERVKGPLAFVNWRPSVGLGMIGDAGRPPGSAGRAHGVVVEVSPFTLDVYIPGSKIVTLRPFGFEMWAGRGGYRNYYLTVGAESPLFYNAWSRLPNFTVGFKAYVPIHTDTGLGARPEHHAGIGLTIGYRITR